MRCLNMSFTFDYIVDPSNKILICEIKGEVSDGLSLTHILKSTVKMAGKNQINYVVHDVTELCIRCPNIEMGKFVMEVQEQGWVTGLKVARIVNSDQGRHSTLARLANRFDLPIKNFTSRSEAMLWLLFNKLPKHH